MDEDKKRGEYKVAEMGGNGGVSSASENAGKAAGSMSGSAAVTRVEAQEGASTGGDDNISGLTPKAPETAGNGPKTQNGQVTGNLNGWDKNYAPKKKKVPLRAILVGVLAIVAVITGVVIAMSNRDSQGEAGKQPEAGDESGKGDEKDEGKDDETQKPTEAELEAEKEKNVRAMVAKMKTALQEYFVTDEGEKLMDFRDTNEVNVLYQAADMEVAIPLAKAIGFEAESTEAVKNDEALQQIIWDKIGGANEVVGVTAVAEKVFTENGFVKTGEEWAPMGEYVNWQTGVICTNVMSGMPILFGCGHISWMNKEKVALANELAVAYREKTGRLLGYLLVEEEDIKDSEVAPYQRLMAQMPGAAALFYRVSPEAKWQFFAGLQSPLSCEDYATEDEKKAFAGEVCYDGNEESAVEP